MIIEKISGSLQGSFHLSNQSIIDLTLNLACIINRESVNKFDGDI